MKSAVLLKPGELEIHDLKRPELGPTEVLIEVELAGICGSDASVYQGNMIVPLPIVPGHEAVGNIVALGKEVKGLQLNQRVTIQPNFSCHNCSICKSGLSNVCPHKVRLGLDIDGVFAQYVKVPYDYVWPVPDSMDKEVAVFTEPTAVAYHALRKANLKQDYRVLVYGAGVIGLLMVQLIIQEGSQVYSFDIVKERLLLSEQLGASTGFQSKDDLAEMGPFDVIYETSGAPAALSDAIELASPGGTIVILGLPKSAHPVLTTPIVRKELNLFGSMIYTDEFPTVLKLLENKTIKTKPLVSDIHNLEELPAALEGFSSPRRIKTLIRIKEN